MYTTRIKTTSNKAKIKEVNCGCHCLCNLMARTKGIQYTVNNIAVIMKYAVITNYSGHFSSQDNINETRS